MKFNTTQIVSGDAEELAREQEDTAVIAGSVSNATESHVRQEAPARPSVPTKAGADTVVGSDAGAGAGAGVGAGENAMVQAAEIDKDKEKDVEKVTAAGEEYEKDKDTDKEKLAPKGDKEPAVDTAHEGGTGMPSGAPAASPTKSKAKAASERETDRGKARAGAGSGVGVGAGAGSGPIVVSISVDVASEDVAADSSNAVVLTISGSIATSASNNGKDAATANFTSDSNIDTNRTFSGINIGRGASTGVATTTGGDLSTGNTAVAASTNNAAVTASIESLLMNSTLLNELRCLYHGLMGGHSLVMRVDRAIDIHIPLCTTAKSSLLQQHEVAGAPEEDESRTDWYPLPDYPYDFLTLLTLGEPDELQDFLTRNDAGTPNPTLLSLLESAAPTMSITELASTLELTSEECWDMSLHLQTWGVACIIPLLTAQSQLYVHPNAPMDAMSTVSAAFAVTFLGQAALVEPETKRGDVVSAGSSRNNLFLDKHEDGKQKACIPPYSLPCFLSVFDGIRPLSKCITLLPAALQAHALDAALWLLRRRMLVNPVPFHAPEEQEAARLLRRRYPLP